MSRMSCRCGFVVSDVQAPCPTTGGLTGSQELDGLDGRFSERLAGYIEAVESGHREMWFMEQGLTNWAWRTHAEVVSDLMTVASAETGRALIECERCGRLHVQAAPGRNQYISFAPDEPGYKAVLRADRRP